MNRQQLTENIELLRRQLHVVGKIHGMTSEVAVSLSQQLDQHIGEYYSLIDPDLLPLLAPGSVKADDKSQAEG